MHFDPASTVFANVLMRAAGSLAPEVAGVDACELVSPSESDLDAFMSTPAALHALHELQRSVTRIETVQAYQAKQLERLVEDLDRMEGRSHDQSKRLAALASDSQVANLPAEPPLAADRRLVVVVSAIAGTGGTTLGLLAERVLSLLF